MRQHHSIASRLSQIGLALLGILFLCISSPAVAADNSDSAITWGVGPVVTEGKPARSAFVHPLIPGQSVSDVVRITNFSLSPQTFQVYAHDAVNTLDGGYDLLSGPEASRDIGLWVRLSQRTVMIPARSRADVPFRIVVPADATPGDHSGGIVAAMLGQSTDQSGRNVTVERRVGTRIYGRVPGAVRATLTAGDPVTRYTESLNPFQPGTATVTYAVRNSGNIRLGAHPSVKVSDPTGRLVRTVAGPDVREVLPGQSVTVSLRIPEVWPRGRLTVEAGVRASLVEGAAVDTPSPSGDTATATFWAWPWPALVLLLLFVLLVLSRRRSRRPERSAKPVPTSIDSQEAENVLMKENAP